MNINYLPMTLKRFPLGYEPDMYVSHFLSPDKASYYQTIIGVMRWMVKLGRVDIAVEVSQLSSFLDIPSKGHMVLALHIMSYLIIKHNPCLVLDPSYSDINLSEVKSDEKFTEAKPHNAPKPLSKKIVLRLFVDSDHAGDKTNRRSCTGYMIFTNMSMIDCHTKKQATAEEAVFGAEFVATKKGIEALRGIRYKLRMMGVEISGPTYIYGYNMSVIHNTSKPESVLKKFRYHLISLRKGSCRNEGMLDDTCPYP